MEIVRPYIEEYPILALPNAKEKIDHYWKTYSPATDFLCFDDDYTAIANHLKGVSDVKTITDIGCAFGVQSLFFENDHYIGIDMYQPYGFPDGQYDEYSSIPFFNEGASNVAYHIARFPDQVTDEMIGDVFISNMSVGYASLEGITKEQMIEVFSKFKYGYFRAPREIANVIFGAFNYYEVVKLSRLGNEMNLYFVTNKGEVQDEYKNL